MTRCSRVQRDGDNTVPDKYVAFQNICIGQQGDASYPKELQSKSSRIGKLSITLIRLRFERIGFRTKLLPLN